MGTFFFIIEPRKLKFDMRFIRGEIFDFRPGNRPCLLNPFNAFYLQVFIIVADHSNEEDNVRAVADTVSKFGQLDVLINNAGNYIY